MPVRCGRFIVRSSLEKEVALSLSSVCRFYLIQVLAQSARVGHEGNVVNIEAGIEALVIGSLEEYSPLRAGMAAEVIPVLRDQEPVGVIPRIVRFPEALQRRA